MVIPGRRVFSDRRGRGGVTALLGTLKRNETSPPLRGPSKNVDNPARNHQRDLEVTSLAQMIRVPACMYLHSAGV